MQREYTAIVKQDGEWRIGWIEEVPGVNCQKPLGSPCRKHSIAIAMRQARSGAGSGNSEIKIGI
jgi:hypothetical protein